jgi:hypothetical protein
MNTSPAGTAPNCWQCRHFRVSHIPGSPYACALMGFRTNILPCIEVLRADGKPCRGFLAKSTVPSRIAS